MIHEINDFYNFESSIYEKLNLENNKKHKLQNNFISGIQNSDYVFLKMGGKFRIIKKIISKDILL